ncbi:Asp23/Gls24 family envelope stress response protein [Candidatus Cryosericum odellii]|nr:Asp23/Gls24 family envelope stress response protein [Candidatus Cryosericum odellii]
MDKVLITDAALESLIVHACLSVEGVESMWKGLKEHFPCWDRGGHEPHGVSITRSGLELTLDVFLVGRFGTDLRKLAGSVRGAVAKEVEASTPYHIQEVNVHIADVRA